MKNTYSQLILCLLAFLATSCGGSDSNDEPIVPEPEKPSYITGINAIVAPSGTFAKNDGSKALNESSSRNVAQLLSKTGPDIAKGLGQINITKEQYQEIKTFTDELVKGLDTSTDVYNTIFRWVNDNIEYEQADNDPYPVFKNRRAICQGYANLLMVMLHSQGIPAMIANGMLIPIGGHAWNYVYLDEWIVSDPTNNGHFLMTEFEQHKHLDPMSLDANLFEDENFVFNFYERQLNIKEVKKGEKKFTVPFSTNGFQIGSFNPDKELPSEIEEIYIGENINTLGESIIGLTLHAPSVKRAYVDSKNKKMQSYGQVVYRDDMPYYVPASAPIVQFKDIATLGKNFLKDHTKVETIVIQQGTKKLEAYAIENCPNLQKAYIPEETSVDANAFYGVHANFKIIRGIVKD